MSPTKEAFEGANDGVWVLAGFGFHHEVGIRGFAKYCCCKFSIGEPPDLTIKECDHFIFFIFDGKLYSLMDFVQAGKEVFYDLLACCWLTAEDSKNIVDIFFEKFRMTNVFSSVNS